MGASGMGPGVYATSAIKEEPVVETAEDPMSPASSPPRKRYRLMAATLPSSTPPSAYPPNGSGIGGDHQQLHQQTHQQQHQHQQHDWHRNHRSDHHPHSGYGQPVWPNAGWINTSYPVGLAQLEDTGYDSPDVAYDRDNSFSPLIGISVGRASSPSSSSSPNHVQQRRLLLRRKQHQPSSVMDSTDSLPSGTRYRSAESVQRVPDVCITMPPELSPLGYVLTPAPTPPDAEDSPSLCYHQGNGVAIEVEQRVPASLPTEPDGSNSSAMSFINAAVLSGQHELAENQQMMLLPANRHYLYQAATAPVASAASASPAETACDPTHPTPSADYQTPATPTSMDYPKP